MRGPVAWRGGKHPDQQLQRFVDLNDYILGARLPDGGFAAAASMVANYQIITGNELEVWHRYSYPDLFTVASAWWEWCRAEFAGEPGGWIRHQPSNRRRPDGDATREYVRP
ncbi:MAG TPA: hypothetical protein VH395_08920 [Jatrophihabitantaceae bacterium]|jgi:hypothetical protein